MTFPARIGASTPSAFLVLALALTACHAKTSAPPAPTGPTYYQDVQPIIQAKCEGCHNAEGIGPFALVTASDVVMNQNLIRSVVSSKVMPPWPPTDSCNEYSADRSLTAAEIQTITDWVDDGAVLGDAATQMTAPSQVGMSRVDFTLQMPETFTPILSPDDYRCFLIDWTPTTAKYVTGFGVQPGDAQIVHHAITYIATPEEVPTYQALEGTDGHPGWTCFGGPGASSSPTAPSSFGGPGSPQWLGSWAPGAVGSDFPANTGVLIQPGSKLILQIHYNTTVNAPAPDQSSINIEVADYVKKPAYVMPFLDPSWLQGNMDIPANAPDTAHSYGVDVTPYMDILTNGVIENAKPFTVYMSGLHMHTRGSSGIGRINHADGTQDCMIDIPSWSFGWQGGYTFAQPKVFSPGDQLYLECHWNNTAANQPVIDGQQVVPHDLNWGETTEDEMCLEILYMTQ